MTVKKKNLIRIVSGEGNNPFFPSRRHYFSARASLLFSCSEFGKIFSQAWKNWRASKCQNI